MKIRKAQRKDLPACIKLFNDKWFDIDASDVRGFHKKGAMYVAIDKKVIGAMVVVKWPTYTTVEFVSVAPKQRRKGVWKAFIEYLGNDYLFLYTAKDNKKMQRTLKTWEKGDSYTCYYRPDK